MTNDPRDMPLRPGILLLIALLMTVLLAAAMSRTASAGEIRCYRERTGEDERLRRWRMQRIGGGYRVSSAIGAERYVNLVSADGNTTGWRAETDRMRIEACRKTNQIAVSGHRGGRPLEKRIDAPDSPWFQSIGFSLELFARSRRKRVGFWTLRPETLEPVKMAAKKESTVEIVVDGKPEKAVRVTLRLAGWKSAIWRGQYWFRERDGTYLRYEGVNGPPGTPKTVVELCSVGCDDGKQHLPEPAAPCR